MGRGPSSGNTGSAGRVEKAIGDVPLWHEGYRPRLNSRRPFFPFSQSFEFNAPRNRKVMPVVRSSNQPMVEA